LIESNGNDEGLECIVSEATGAALRHATHSLSLYQAVQQLSKLYQCEPTWEAIKTYRSTIGFNKVTHQCFEASKIECILMDDLFASSDKTPYSYTWHDKYTTSKTKRIVRIESLAEQIAQTMTLADVRKFTELFLRSLVQCAKDPDVVGFKSVVCYRTGLDISFTAKDKMESKSESFIEYLTNANKTGSFRLEKKTLNDMICNLALHVSGEYRIPIQFHTGLGDNDICLVKSNPAYMQTIIKSFPKAIFVLLHSAYPYTREAGYLTTVYDNVYLDCIAFT
jgi:hypothetical protein